MAGRTVNLWDIYGIIHHCLCISASGSACDAVYRMNFARAIKLRFFFPASFTFMIKARTKMDKPATV